MSTDLRKRAKSAHSSFSDFYAAASEKHPFLFSVLVPALLTISGVFVLAVKPPDYSMTMSFVIALLAYSSLIILKTALDYHNTKQSILLSRKISSVVAQLKHLDSFEKRRCQSMSEAINSASDPGELLRRSRGKLKFDKGASALNEEAARSIIDYLGSYQNISNVHFVCKLLAPNKFGEFCVVGSWYKTGGTRTPNRNTGLTIHMQNCLAKQVWDDRARSILSVPDVEVAEKGGNFVFVHESQRDNLKSACCFRVTDEHTGDPIAIWTIDADKVAVFPENGSAEIHELNRIFSSFATKLTLEWMYSNILDQTESVYERAIES